MQHQRFAARINQIHTCLIGLTGGWLYMCGPDQTRELQTVTVAVADYHHWYTLPCSGMPYKGISTGNNDTALWAAEHKPTHLQQPDAQLHPLLLFALHAVLLPLAAVAPQLPAHACNMIQQQCTGWY